MRISDWSSDVCSSDLGGASPLADTRIDGGARHGGNRIGAETRPRLRRVQRLERERAERFGLEADGAVDRARLDRGDREPRAADADPPRVRTRGARTEERRVGEEGVSAGRARGERSTYQKQKKTQHKK